MIAKATEAIVSGFKGHPMVLAIVVLNVAFIGAALYFLHTLAESAGHSRDQLMKENSAHFELLLKLCAPRYGKWEP